MKLTTCTAEAMNIWICAPTSPYIFVVLCLIKQGRFAVLPNCVSLKWWGVESIFIADLNPTVLHSNGGTASGLMPRSNGGCGRYQVSFGVKELLC